MNGERLHALDAFRGLTVAGMLLVNNPGRWGVATQYAQLRHAAWHGVTFTDLIFPFFLFIVGVSVSISIPRRLARGDTARAIFEHALRRGAALVLLGLFQSRFPFYPRSSEGFLAAVGDAGEAGILLRIGLLGLFVASLWWLLGHPRRRQMAYALGGSVALAALGLWLDQGEDRSWLYAHLDHSRVPGVLQRIAVCYVVAVAMLLFVRPLRGLVSGHDVTSAQRWLVAVIAGLLVAYACFMLYVPIPGFGTPDLDIPLWNDQGDYNAVFSNWCSYVDKLVFGIRCYRHGVRDGVFWAFDPEGLVSTIPAIATVLLGLLAGGWLVRRRGSGTAFLIPILSSGIALLVLGALTSFWMPLNKRLWTSSYVLWTAGAAILALAVLIYCIDVRGWKRVAMPAVWYGRNAIAAFWLSSLAATMSVYLRVAQTQLDGTSKSIPLKSWIYQEVFVPLAGPLNGSLLYATGVVLVWAAIVGVMYRKRIFLKL